MNNKALENPNLITVMVPTYNRIDKLKRCVESIFNQTCSDFDLVISDNASTYGTKEYLESFRDKPNVSIIGLLCFATSFSRYNHEAYKA